MESVKIFNFPTLEIDILYRILYILETIKTLILIQLIVYTSNYNHGVLLALFLVPLPNDGQMKEKREEISSLHTYQVYSLTLCPR